MLPFNCPYDGDAIGQSGPWEWGCKCGLKFGLDAEPTPNSYPLLARLMVRVEGVFAQPVRCPGCGEKLTEGVSWVGMLVWACPLCQRYALTAVLEGSTRDLELLDQPDLRSFWAVKVT